MASIVDRLKAAYEEGFVNGRKATGKTSPYLQPEEAVLAQSWSEGYDEGVKQAERDEHWNRVRAERAARKAAFEANMEAVFGDDWAEQLGEFIDARTR